MPYRLEDMRTVRFTGPITEEQILLQFGIDINIVIKNVGQYAAPILYATFPSMERAVAAFLATDGVRTDDGEIIASMCAAPDVRLPFTDVTSFYESEANM